MTIAYCLLSLDFCFTHSFPQLVPDATNCRADILPFCGFSTPSTLTLIPCITMALRVDTALPHTLPPSILPTTFEGQWYHPPFLRGKTETQGLQQPLEGYSTRKWQNWAFWFQAFWLQIPSSLASSVNPLPSALSPLSEAWDRSSPNCISATSLPTGFWLGPANRGFWRSLVGGRRVTRPPFPTSMALAATERRLQPPLHSCSSARRAAPARSCQRQPECQLGSILSRPGPGPRERLGISGAPPSCTGDLRTHWVVSPPRDPSRGWASSSEVRAPPRRKHLLQIWLRHLTQRSGHPQCEAPRPQLCSAGPGTLSSHAGVPAVQRAPLPQGFKWASPPTAGA